MQTSAIAGTSRSCSAAIVSSRLRVPSAISAVAESTAKRPRSRAVRVRLRAASTAIAVTAMQTRIRWT